MVWVFIFFLVGDILAWLLYFLERKKSYIFMGVLVGVLCIAALICSILLGNAANGA